MTYISIERIPLEVRHKHQSRNVVTGLAYIELSHVQATVQEVSDDANWDSFTDYELKKLYQNMTGHKYDGFSRPRLLQLVSHAAQALPESDVNEVDLAAQVTSVMPTDKGFYRYVKGARRPASMQELFTPPALTALTVPPDAVPAAGRDRTPVAATPLAPQATAPRPAQRAPSAPKGGSRVIIYEVADAMWNAAGAPRDTATVLSLRKRIMQALETDHGVKKTTSSTALGDWQKARLNA